MGTYCELYIADYPVFSWKSSVEPVVMTIFRETDKRVFTRSVSQRNPIAWGHLEGASGDIETAIEYRTTVAAALDRLRVMGYDARHIRREFSEAKAARIDELNQWSEGRDDRLWDDELALLKESEFDDFLEAYRRLLTSGVSTHEYLERHPDSPALIRHVVSEEHDILLGFPSSDLRSMIGALLLAMPGAATVVQDITDLVDAGYYAEDDEVCGLALAELNGMYPSTSRVIVLTEGVTDLQVIEGALAVLYPHLVGYYSFLDLAMRPPGGAGTLANVVKSFAAAGIENRVVALFDNDTAGRAEIASLGRLSLPGNLRVLHYPDLDLARAYPALGPTGLVVQDVNGLACSIELFFGPDVLTVDGGLVPIQWKGYNERLRAYQGEVMKKDLLKSRFLEKLARAHSSGASPGGTGWEEMHVLLCLLFDAFNT